MGADVSFTDDAITVDGKVFKVLNGRDPAAMPWKDMDVECIIESTGAFNSLEGGSKHIDAGAKKVVLTAPGRTAQHMWWVSTRRIMMQRRTLSCQMPLARPTAWHLCARCLTTALKCNMA